MRRTIGPVLSPPLACRLAGLALFAWACGSGMGAGAGAAAPQASNASTADSAALQPFTASYALDWHGITAGFATLSLVHIVRDTYQYTSDVRARGIFHIAFPDPVHEISTFRFSMGHVLPLTYREDNGQDPKNQDATLTFDWADARVLGMAGDKHVDQPLQPGTLDPLSVQIELMHDLVMQQVPATFLLFDKTSANQYDYTRERTETLDTPLGHLDTVIYRSDRPGYDRVLRLWLAPSLGYLPVQAERRRKGKIEFALHIQGLKHPSGSSSSSEASSARPP